MLKKQSYFAPEADRIELKFESIICQSLTGNGIESGTLDDWGTLESAANFDDVVFF